MMIVKHPKFFCRNINIVICDQLAKITIIKWHLQYKPKVYADVYNITYN